MLGKGWSDDAVLVRNQVSVPSLLFLAVGLIVFSPNQQEAAHERQEPPGGTTTNSTKYATPDEVQAALERGREVLAKHQVAVDPVV